MLNQKRIIHRAGLIPICINSQDFFNSKMMFMIPSDSRYCGSDPQIAKGQIEEGETAEQAALREAHEELGLRSDNIIQLFDCGIWLGRTTMFVAIVQSDHCDCYDDTCHETKEIKWLDLPEFKQIGRDIHIDVIDNLLQLVNVTLEFE